jgi:N-acyl amino acid synthase of PEP-CTERM/exosortase system
MPIIPLEPALRLGRELHPRNIERYFAFACVDGSDEIEECYRLRYEVFCVERGFLPCEDYPGQLESDAYDAHALHFLASHLHGEPAGTARLVLNSPLGLPMVPHCPLDAGFRFLADPQHPLRHRYAEISRLAVSRGFRRRQGDTVYGGLPRTNRTPDPRAAPSTTPPNDVPEMVSGIFRLIYQESKRHGVTHWVVAMERSLQIVLQRMGFPFSPIGPEADYYGPVRPYMAEIAALERNIGQLKPATLDYVASGLEPHLRPAFAHWKDPSEPSQDAVSAYHKVRAA